MAHTFITGGIGSGKTRLAARLQEITGFGVVSLDAIFFDLSSANHREKKEPSVRGSELERELQKEHQIFEGWHFGDWLIPLYRRLSFVIIVDVPLELRQERIKARFHLRKAGQEFDPFPKGDNQHLENLLQWTRIFDADRTQEEIGRFCPKECSFIREDGLTSRIESIAQQCREANALLRATQG
ncbi:MAG: hypothetical protein NTV93_18720 [Verrucomicrobia bacterium]|nr:hypothetical protein [Verrucomicrobiota bacterium]